MVGAFDCLGQSWPKNATDSQGEPLQPILKLWVSRFYVKSVSYTMKPRPWCPKYALFSQPQLSQVVLSCFFFQIVNPSVTSWLGGIFVILRASNKHTLLFWPFPCTKTSPEVHFFLSKTRSQDSTSCTAFQCGRDSEATRRSCYAHHSTWKLRKQTQKLASVRNALFNHFCIFIQQVNTPSASVSFSQTRSIQTRGKFNS